MPDKTAPPIARQELARYPEGITWLIAAFGAFSFGLLYYFLPRAIIILFCSEGTTIMTPFFAKMIDLLKSLAYLCLLAFEGVAAGIWVYNKVR